jgi:hypothetical protein
MLLNFSRSDVEHAILAQHARRSRNTGPADWPARIGAGVTGVYRPRLR